MIPDLWSAGEDQERLYALYLLALARHGQHGRVVTACRAIRRHAARGPGVSAALFTCDCELDALCALGRYGAAWRRLREREAILFGERLDLRRREWPAEMASQLEYAYAPLLYFLGRERRGCALLEAALESAFIGPRVRSFDILFRIANGDPEPESRYQVTLKHFYDRLGKNLREWRRWGAFVDGLHPRLFRLAGIDRRDLLGDGAALTPLVNRLLEVRDARTFTGVGGAQADLLDSPARVQRRQEALAEKLDRFEERIAPVHAEVEAKLRALFPELDGRGGGESRATGSRATGSRGC
jgi:hypothetical protein